MSGAHSGSGSDAAPQPGTGTIVIAVLALATIVLGVEGSRIHAEGIGELHPDIWSEIYHTLQLFVLHAPHLEGDIPWQLHAARFLGGFVGFLGLVKLLGRFFRESWLVLRLRLPFAPRHAIVCGLGERGTLLALDGARRGKWVVAIESHSTPALRLRMLAHNVLVIDGDATDPLQLWKAVINRADQMVVTGPDDRTNVAIAEAARDLTSQSRRNPLMIHLLVEDPDTRSALESSALATPVRNFRVNFRDLDPEAHAARVVLIAHPLDLKPIGENEKTRVRAIVVGSGAMATRMILQVARIAHFANGTSTGIRTRITVVNSDSTQFLSQLRARHKYLDGICDLGGISGDTNDIALARTLVEECAGKNGSPSDLVTFAICLSDEAGFRLGTELAARLKDLPAQILVHQTVTRGFGSLIETRSKNQPMHAFGMREKLFNWDEILRETFDNVAAAVHEGYRLARRYEGATDETNPRWEDLTDDLRDSNRCAADHIPTKLRAIGCYDADENHRGTRVETFTAEEILLMARMEHERWCAERRVANWEHGAVSVRKDKVNRFLVRWDQLNAEDQGKDVEQIQGIPAALKRVGRAVFRR